MENLIIPQDKLPWYKDADATGRIMANVFSSTDIGV